MNPPLPMEGVLPPDLQGTLVRVGPGDAEAGRLHAIELRDGQAISYDGADTSGDANVLWHAGSLLALAEIGLPQQFSRRLTPQEFDGGLTVPIGSHVHRDPNTDGRVLFALEQGTEESHPHLQVGEWDALGALIHHTEVDLERATWQHDLGVTVHHIVFIESPTAWSPGLEAEGSAVPYHWTPGDETWLGVVRRDGSTVRWIRLDPCLVTHILHAHEEGGTGAGTGAGAGAGAGAGGDDATIVLYVCRYDVPEKGQPVDLESSVVGPAGIGASYIGGGLGVLERWRIDANGLEQRPLDERFVEYPQADPHLEGLPFRYGYGVELAPNYDGSLDTDVTQVGLLRFDVARDEVAVWRPGAHRVASEPLFVRAADGRSDDEGWLLSVVFDATRDASDLYVLDASSLGRSPQAVIHLPVSLPFRSHGTWVGAERYR